MPGVDLFDLQVFNLIGTYSVKDETQKNLGKYFIEEISGIFKIRECHSESFHDRYDGENITFKSKRIPDITMITPSTQESIFSAIINGIMYYTHSAIPSPTASNVPFNETGMYYKLYDGSITALLNMFPQR